MLHPHTEVRWISEEIGCGVFATSDIPQGTIIWALDPLDRVFSPAQLEALPAVCRESVLKYTYRNRHGDYVFCWDNTRFMNHNFKPNCITTPYNFELAVRDISAGEELTNDYGSLNIIVPFCVCDEDSSRDAVYPDDLSRYYPLWDEQLRQSFPQVPEVEQLLRPLIADPLWEKVCLIAQDTGLMSSLIDCLHCG